MAYNPQISRISNTYLFRSKNEPLLFDFVFQWKLYNRDASGVRFLSRLTGFHCIYITLVPEGRSQCVALD